MRNLKAFKNDRKISFFLKIGSKEFCKKVKVICEMGKRKLSDGKSPPVKRKKLEHETRDVSQWIRERLQHQKLMAQEREGKNLSRNSKAFQGRNFHRLKMRGIIF